MQSFIIGHQRCWHCRSFHLLRNRQALAVCAAAGVVKDQIHELERWQQICARRGLAAPLAADALALLRGALA